MTGKGLRCWGVYWYRCTYCLVPKRMSTKGSKRIRALFKCCFNWLVPIEDNQPIRCSLKSTLSQSLKLLKVFLSGRLQVYYSCVIYYGVL